MLAKGSRRRKIRFKQSRPIVEDVAFNEDGEMLTFDADMEWDAGAPWYRPTRINHIISGADYGWRRGKN